MSELTFSLIQVDNAEGNSVTIGGHKIWDCAAWLCMLHTDGIASGVWRVWCFNWSQSRCFKFSYRAVDVLSSEVASAFVDFGLDLPMQELQHFRRVPQ